MADSALRNVLMRQKSVSQKLTCKITSFPIVKSKEKIHQIRTLFFRMPLPLTLPLPFEYLPCNFYPNDQATNWTLRELVLLGYLVSGKFTHSSPVSWCV